MTNSGQIMFKNDDQFAWIWLIGVYSKTYFLILMLITYKEYYMIMMSKTNLQKYPRIGYFVSVHYISQVNMILW